MTDFRLLGPLEVRGENGPLRVPPGKPSALLARLLLDANRVVAVEALLAALWGEAAPPSAPKVLQGYVSQLRRAVGADRIETRPPGYALRASRDEIDLRRFEALTEQARSAPSPERRAELLRSALALWRGPALLEFRREPFAHAAAVRLSELRLDALERRIEAELELGMHGRLVGELEAIVAEEPLREPLRASLMLALYRSGRQAEALERFREGRRLLIEKLGIEPSPALQELQRAILRQDPRLDERREPDERPRGAVIAVGVELAELVAPLCDDGRELVLVELARGADDLPASTASLDAARRLLAGRVVVRTACFTSERPADDLRRLAEDQGAELVVVGGFDERVNGIACDVAFAARPELGFAADGPVLVPFGGGREEWAAVEVGAWLARAHGVPLHLLGVRERDDRRDASRTLASASLALQRFSGGSAEPVLVAPGAEGILAERGCAVVASLPPGELDATRMELVERTTVPVLFVRAGLRPSGLAPTRTLTRFSWSLRDEA